jgi:DNA glycosylase AlkZ-like
MAAPMTGLSLRELNRATLDRQLLLGRQARPARWAIEHLTALQAQAPLAPYVGLWTRLAGFRHEDLEDLLTERSVVRAHLLRNTMHLLTAEDFLGFRALFRCRRAAAPPRARCWSTGSGGPAGRSPRATGVQTWPCCTSCRSGR